MAKMKKKMIEIILVAALLICIFFYRKSNNEVEQELMKKGEVAIGTVLSVGNTGWYSRANVSYIF